jgi:hypothetical protein
MNTRVPETDKEVGYVVMKAARPVAFSQNEGDARRAALRRFNPDGLDFKFSDTGKLYVKVNWRWRFTACEVVEVECE